MAYPIEIITQLYTERVAARFTVESEVIIDLICF